MTNKETMCTGKKFVPQTKETLSDKKIPLSGPKIYGAYPEKDVKESVKNLKDEIRVFSQNINDHRANQRWFQLKKILELKKEIDKIFGDKLT